MTDRRTLQLTCYALTAESTTHCLSARERTSRAAGMAGQGVRLATLCALEDRKRAVRALAKPRFLSSLFLTCLIVVGLLTAPAATARADSLRDFTIAAQPLDTALKAFALQAQREIFFTPDLTHGKKTHGINGKFQDLDALKAILDGTGLTYSITASKAILVRDPAVPMASSSGESTDTLKSYGKGGSDTITVAQANGQDNSSEGPQEKAKQSDSAAVQSANKTRLEEVVVTGSRLSRAGSEGAQDVKIYNRERIDQSGQATVADFLNTLPEVSLSSVEATYLATSVKLRGLPEGSTLILINGRRVQSSSGNAGAFGFFDLNLIPLAAVERVEVLPTGSSAVYGGDALAGVVNIVLKKDFVGTSGDIGYGAAADTNEKTASAAWGWKSDAASVSVIAGFLSQSPLFGTDRAITSSQNFSQYAGGTDQRLPFSNPGNVYSVDGSNLPGLNSSFAAVPLGSTGVGLTPASFAGTAGTQNLASYYSYESLVSKTDRGGLFASGRYIVNSQLEVFGELLLSLTKLTSYGAPPILVSQLVPASNAFNPFGVPVTVNYLETGAGDSDTIFNDVLVRPVIGARGTLASTWSWELTGLLSQDKGSVVGTNQPNTAVLTTALASADPSVAYNPFKDGPGASPAVLNSIYQDQRSEYRGQSKSVNGFVKGSVLSLPGGPLDVVLGAEYEGTSLFTNQYGTTNASRNAYSMFAEGRMPLIAGPIGAGIGSETLVAQVAVRDDHYSDFGSKATTQIGLEFRPDGSLLLRGTYGTAFKPPSLYDEASPVSTYQTIVMDPLRGGQSTAVTVSQGGNTSLAPTTGESATAGFVYSPREVQGLNVSVTGWYLRLANGISLPTAQYMALNAADYPGRVIRGPATNGQPGQIISIDGSYVNFGLTKESGVDFAVDWHFATPIGDFFPNVAATYITKFLAADSPGAPLTNRDSRADPGYSGVYAPRLKGTASIGWKPSPELTVALMGRYVSRYTDYDGIHELGDFWYADGSVEYRVGSALKLQNPAGKNLKITLGVTNLFNRLPSYSQYFFGYDPYVYDIVGRFIYTRLGVEF
jgi:iron complex outermembrane receptor protein